MVVGQIIIVDPSLLHARRNLEPVQQPEQKPALEAVMETVSRQTRGLKTALESVVLMVVEGTVELALQVKHAIQPAFVQAR
jgi:hypothetical protein